MFYGGERGVPGAPGNVGGTQLAGSPGYFMPETEINKRIFKQGMQASPLGEDTQKRIQDFRNKYPGVFGAQAGISPVGNVGFYAGPQFGQAGQSIPAGFQNKYVS